MKKTRIENNSFLCLVLTLIVLCFSVMFTSGTVSAKAETTETTSITSRFSAPS